jgi:hypothetical protein
MDIGRYQADRQKELERFQKDYSDMKKQYSELLSKAVTTSDPKIQSEVIRQVLSVNSNLAQHVRDFIQESGGKFDQSMISKLTADIIKFQKEYDEIQKSDDKTRALDGILNKERNFLKDLHSQFNIFLGLLLAMIVIIIGLIFKTSITQMSRAAADLLPSTSSPDLGYSSPSLFGSS